MGKWQLVCNGRGLQVREACALGEVVKQKALPMKLVGRVDGASFLQQSERCGMCGACRFDHGFVFGRVLVGLEQDFVEH